MIEYAKMQKDVRKDYMDSIIDPKNQTISFTYLTERIKAL
jgi:hypothetical protein